MGSILKDLLQDILSEEELAVLPSAFDVIGHIAIIKLPQELKDKGVVVGEAIAQVYPRVKTVLSVGRGTKGNFRLRGYTLIWGEPPSETVYREHGCRFAVDITRVFFNPRLSHERLRIAELVRPGETVTNMFAGTGIMSIIIARKQRVERVYSIDINPWAYYYTKKNVQLNKVRDKVTPILGDARQAITSFLQSSSERVLMPLPSVALDFMEAAIEALKADKGGIIHFYHECEAKDKKQAIEKSITALRRRVKPSIDFEILASRVVRAVAPYRYHIAVDVKINPPLPLNIALSSEGPVQDLNS